MNSREGRISIGAETDPGRLLRGCIFGPILDLAADLGKKIVVNPGLHKRTPKPAVGRFIRDAAMRIEPGKQHEVQPDPQAFFQLGIAKPMPLPPVSGKLSAALFLSISQVGGIGR